MTKFRLLYFYSNTQRPRSNFQVLYFITLKKKCNYCFIFSTSHLEAILFFDPIYRNRLQQAILSFFSFLPIFFFSFVYTFFYILLLLHGKKKILLQ